MKAFGGNSGYVGYSKSRRAVLAESEGLRNASQMNKAFADEVNARILAANPAAPKVTLKQIKSALNEINADEWHHTSKFGNRTNYYSAETIAEFFTPETDEQKAARESREACEREYRELVQAEEAEIYSGLANVAGYFAAQNGMLVRVYKSGVEMTFDNANIIPAGIEANSENERNAGGLWFWGNKEEVEAAINDYNSARAAIINGMPKERTARIAELATLRRKIF